MWREADAGGTFGCAAAVGGGLGVEAADAFIGPEPSRAVQRDFWRRIASGVTTLQAAEAVGVSWPVGSRWFRHAGGMPPISLDEPTGRYLSFAEPGGAVEGSAGREASEDREAGGRRQVA